MYEVLKWMLFLPDRIGVVNFICRYWPLLLPIAVAFLIYCVVLDYKRQRK